MSLDWATLVIYDFGDNNNTGQHTLCNMDKNGQS